MGKRILIYATAVCVLLWVGAITSGCDDVKKTAGRLLPFQPATGTAGQPNEADQALANLDRAKPLTGVPPAPRPPAHKAPDGEGTNGAAGALGAGNGPDLPPSARELPDPRLGPAPSATAPGRGTPDTAVSGTTGIDEAGYRTEYRPGAAAGGDPASPDPAPDPRLPDGRTAMDLLEQADAVLNRRR